MFRGGLRLPLFLWHLAPSQEYIPGAAAAMLGVGGCKSTDQGPGFRQIQPIQERAFEDAFPRLTLTCDHDHALSAFGLLACEEIRQHLKRGVSRMPMKIKARRYSLPSAAHSALILPVLRWRIRLGSRRRWHHDAGLLPFSGAVWWGPTTAFQRRDMARCRRPGTLFFFGEISPAHAMRFRAIPGSVQSSKHAQHCAYERAQRPHVATKPIAVLAH